MNCHAYQESYIINLWFVNFRELLMGVAHALNLGMAIQESSV